MIAKKLLLSSRTGSKRRGYALLFVVLIAAIGGMAVMGIAHTVRFETFEVQAKQKELIDRHTAILSAEKAKARTPTK